MVDIFISYKREDRGRVKALAADLEAEGFSVWWDPELEIGVAYSKSIAEKLNSAKAVVVAWSAQSVASDWVQEEANEGKQRGVLVPLKLDAVDPPLGFGMLQTADLSGELPPERRQEEWARLIERLRRLTKAAAAPAKPDPPAKPQPGPRRAWPMALAAALVAVTLGGAGYWYQQSLLPEAQPGTANSGSGELVSTSPPLIVGAQPQDRPMITVWTQIGSGQDRGKIAAIKQKLNGLHFKVLGPENVGAKAKTNDVRYCNDSNQADANELKAIVDAMGWGSFAVFKIGRCDPQANLNMIELWLKPGD